MCEECKLLQLLNLPNITIDSSSRKRKATDSVDNTADKKSRKNTSREDNSVIIVNCTNCGKFFHGSFPKNHVQNCQPESSRNTRELTCIWCKKAKSKTRVYDYESVLIRHLKTCRNKPPNITMEHALLECGIKTEKKKQKLPRNKPKNKIKKEEPIVQNNLPELPLVQYPTLQKSFYCSFDDCGIQFKSKELMDIHHRRVGILHRCEYCSYISEWESSLVFHFISCHPKILPQKQLCNGKHYKNSLSYANYQYDPFDGEGFCSDIT